MLIVLTLSRDRSRCDDLRADLASHGGLHRFVSLEGATDIASGYDTLVERSGAAPDDLLCFLHEDARLHFAAGDVLPRVAEAIPRAGVLGFCGTASQQPGRAWWRCPPRYGGVRQGAGDPVDLRFRTPTREAAGVAVEPVDTLDGYCLVVRREVLDRVGGFRGAGVGWHGYDVELCLRVRAAGFVNHVLDLPTSHWSWGTADDQLADALAQQAERWGAALDPGSSSDVAERPEVAPPERPSGRPSVHVYGLGLDDAAAVDGFVASCGEADGVHVLDLGSTDGTPSALAARGIDVASVATPDRVDLARNLALGLVPDDVDLCVALDVRERLVDGWRAEVERAWRDGATSLRHRVRVGDGWWPPPQELAAGRVHLRRDHVWMGAVHPRLWSVHANVAHEAEVATVLITRPGVESDLVGAWEDEPTLLGAALAADGCDGPSALLLALGAAQADRWDEAVALIDRALGSGRLSPAERSLACLLRSEAPGEQEEWWLLRACDEDPTLAGAWLELADCNRRDGDAMGAWWAARWALAVDGVPPAPWPVAPEWRWMGDDLAAWAAWELGLVDKARHHAFAALVANPFDERLRDDHRAIERAAVGAVRPPVFAGPAAVDVVVLSYAKTRREYDLTSRCIEALRAASPSVPMRVVVVETNERLRREPFVTGERALFGPEVTVVQPGGPFAYNTFLRAGLAALDRDPAPAVLVLNNDIEAFSEGFVEELLTALDTAAPDTVDSVSPLGLREGLWWQPSGDDAVILDDHVSRGLVGWCILVARRVLEQVGASELFPDELVWYEQDTHYAAVLRSEGYRHGVARRARALHLQSASHGLLGETLALPADVPEILRMLGTRGLRVLVVGDDAGLCERVRAFGPAELVVVDADASWDVGGDLLAAGTFDRVVVVAGEGRAIDTEALLRWWALARPAGWVIGRHDAAAVAAALEGFAAATGVTSSVRTGAAVATHWALQVPS